MNKIIISFLLISIFSISTKAQHVSVIPQPVSVEEADGFFKINSRTIIISDQVNQSNVTYLQKVLGTMVPEKLTIKNKGSKGIILVVNTGLSEKLGKEGYYLEVGKKNVTITGSTKTGVFYGIQTFRQLLTEDINSKKIKLLLPMVKIEDKPRFSWRSFMLDESRYFKGMDEVKKILDQMALLKMNVFHWHLTDDQGWRIEIKKYPKLTEVGSYRKNSQIGGWDNDKRSGKPHSGFYTQEQIKDIIAYATERSISIVPEIEMPGHASAAITAYPCLGTIGELKEVPVIFGKLPDSFDVSDPRVYEFIENVLSEVMELFPGKTIHIGGDEVRFGAWKKSEKIQQFMKINNLLTPADLQIFFTNRVSNFIDKKDHRMMGWNEILGGNVHEWQNADDVQVKEKLAKSAIIHFWKGSIDLLTDAVTSGYDIVNSHHVYTYLDYSYEYIPIEKAYGFDPIPEGLDKKVPFKSVRSWMSNVGRVDSEVSDMDQMMFPRLAAYAEVGWTVNERKNLKVFRTNLKQIMEIWKKEGIGFQKSNALK